MNMAEKKELVKCKGVFTFNPKDNAPNFVLGTIVITLEDFLEFVKGEGREYVTDYKGKRQIKLNVTSMKEGRGILVAVDTWKPSTGVTTSTDKPIAESGMKDDFRVPDANNYKDDLPF